MDTKLIQKLLHAAAEAKKNAYAPYSHFAVGAAVLAADGSMFTGCNVENVSYPCGFCAERNAIGSAVAAGQQHFSAIAIVGSNDDFTTPCGMCRQVIAEFHIPFIICGKNETEYRTFSLDELLPAGFDESKLREKS